MRWAAVKLRKVRPLIAIPNRAESGGRASLLQAPHFLHPLQLAPAVPLFAPSVFSVPVRPQACCSLGPPQPGKAMGALKWSTRQG